MKYRYFTCDVFTSSRFGGNPLAVLPWATGLTAESMQAIAREFNFSETAFVFPPEQGQTRRVRIFTPTQEVPFAGHPNIGTAFTLASIGEIDTEATVTFEEDGGLVPIDVRRQGDAIWCELRAPQSLQLGKTLPADTVARCLSLDATDIVTSNHDPQEASVGLPFLVVELRDREALGRATPIAPCLQDVAAAGIVADVLAYVGNQADSDLHVRMFAPLDGVPEDPATGSANCALVGMLAQIRARGDGEQCWQIRQGYEMGRPSQLFARTWTQDGKLNGTWIGGTCVMVCEGDIETG